MSPTTRKSSATLDFTDFQPEYGGLILQEDVNGSDYLSPVNGVVTKEILVHKLTTILSMPMVYRTLDKLKQSSEEN